MARHYFARGLCEACVGAFREAVEDLDMVLRVDESFADAYLVKGKCAFLCGDTAAAFECYRRIMELGKDDPRGCIHAGNLLVAAGELEEAGRMFASAGNSAIAYCHLAKVF